MKKTIVGIALCCCIGIATLVPVFAQTNANSNSNTNVNTVNAQTNATHGGMQYFHASATLVPLLLVPLAGILYVIYEKISKRE